MPRGSSGHPGTRHSQHAVACYLSLNMVYAYLFGCSRVAVSRHKANPFETKTPIQEVIYWHELGSVETYENLYWRLYIEVNLHLIQTTFCTPFQTSKASKIEAY